MKGVYHYTWQEMSFLSQEDVKHYMKMSVFMGHMLGILKELSDVF